MNYVHLSSFLQTWLLSAQVFSTREFSQLAIRRILPKLAGWFTILVLPMGFALDGTILHFNVSVGIMGVLYTTVYILRSTAREHMAYAVTIFLSLAGMDLWEYGRAPVVLIHAWALVILLTLISLVLRGIPTNLGVTVSCALCVIAEFVINIGSGFQFNDTAVTLMTAVMSGMYVTFRSRHDQFVRDTHEAVQYDVLTKALTRRGLKTWLERCAQKGENEGIIVFCDLDNFKWVNDMWGHEVGDRVLQEFVGRIRQGLRPNDAIARFGGDEYQVWIPMQEMSSAEPIVERLHTLATQGTYDVIDDGAGLHIGVSMGWTYGEFSDKNANEADFALLAAKRSGKNRVMQSSFSDGNTEHHLQSLDDSPHLYWLTNIAESLWSDAHYPFVLTDKSGHILVANQAYEHLVGRTVDELRGNKPGMNSANQTPRNVYQNMWSNLSNGQPWNGCLLNKREDGTEWWELAELFPVTLSGQIVGYWGLAQSLDEAQFPHAGDRSNYRWHGEIEWAFQPIMDTDSLSVLGYEALARPKWGSTSVRPDTFFRIAEHLDCHSPADWACMESLLERLQTMPWPRDTRLFLNVYAGTIRHEQKIRQWLQRFYEMLPETICVFEILEHHIDPIDVGVWRDLQVEFPLIELAQDDFGAGEHDILRMARVKPDWVKLDRGWVSTLSEHPESQSLLMSIIDWAALEGIKVILEGVETHQQAQLYRRLGVRHEQGYFWGRPQEVPGYDSSVSFAARSTINVASSIKANNSTKVCHCNP